jgi:hypothetical protein
MSESPAQLPVDGECEYQGSRVAYIDGSCIDQAIDCDDLGAIAGVVNTPSTGRFIATLEEVGLFGCDRCVGTSELIDSILLAVVELSRVPEESEL